MAAQLEKTRTPRIYKRGGRYVFGYRASRKHPLIASLSDDDRSAESVVSSSSSPGQRAGAVDGATCACEAAAVATSRT